MVHFGRKKHKTEKVGTFFDKTEARAQQKVARGKKCFRMGFLIQVHVNFPQNFGIDSTTMTGPICAQSHPAATSAPCCHKSDSPFNFNSVKKKF